VTSGTVPGGEDRVVRIADVVGPRGLTAEEGRRLYDRLHPALLGGGTVEVDFGEVGEFTEPFLDAAIGRLLRDIPPGVLLSRLVVRNATVRQIEAVRWVLERASRDGAPRPAGGGPGRDPS